MNNLDVQALRRIFDLLQTHFPERLSELWFLNAPWIFWGAPEHPAPGEKGGGPDANPGTLCMSNTCAGNSLAHGPHEDAACSAGLWRMVSPFISPATRSKITFLSGGQRQKMLESYIPMEVSPVPQLATRRRHLSRVNL